MSVECDRIGGVNLAQGVCDTDSAASAAQGAVDAIDRASTPTPASMASPRCARPSPPSSPPSTASTPIPKPKFWSPREPPAHSTPPRWPCSIPATRCLVLEPFYGYHVSTLASHAYRAGRRAAGRAPVAAGYRPSARRRHAAHPRHHRQQSRQSLGQGLLAAQNSRPSPQFAIDHDLFVFTDEMYEYFLFDGARHISLATLPGMAERTITISGFSKTFSMTGWRWAISRPAAAGSQPSAYFHDLVYICAPAPVPIRRGRRPGRRCPARSIATSRRVPAEARQLCAALTVPASPVRPRGRLLRPRRCHPHRRQTAAAKAPAAARRNRGRRRGRLRLLRLAAAEENLLRFCFGKQPEALDRACAALRKL